MNALLVAIAALSAHASDLQLGLQTPDPGGYPAFVVTPTRPVANLWVSCEAGGKTYADERRGVGADEPKIEVKAKRQHMLNPVLAAKGYGKRIHFNARLTGEPEDPETYYCLDEIWDWGDGTESVYEPDCDPYTSGAELKRNFADTHVYGRGKWRIAFALMHLDEVVVDGTLDINIH